MLTILENQQQSMGQLMGQLRDIDLMIRVNQEVPAQVLLSKPIILLDARGRYAPFFIEFIDTAEVNASFNTTHSSATYLVYIGFHRRLEDSIQGHRPT